MSSRSEERRSRKRTEKFNIDLQKRINSRGRIIDGMMAFSLVLLSSDFLGVVGKCRECDRPVVEFLCNPGFIKFRPAAESCDYFAMCINPYCRRYKGDEIFSGNAGVPDWIESFDLFKLKRTEVNLISLDNGYRYQMTDFCESKKKEAMNITGIPANYFKTHKEKI